jgi:transposase
MSRYLGLDVSTNEAAICFGEESGDLVWAGTSLTDPDVIAAVLEWRGLDVIKIGIEAGNLTARLGYSLTELGVPIVCLNARHTSAALKLQMNKMDRNDTLGLMRLVRSERYRPVAVQSIENPSVARLLTTRD